jgi:hypothetical protein
VPGRRGRGAAGAAAGCAIPQMPWWDSEAKAAESNNWFMILVYLSLYQDSVLHLCITSTN